MVSMRAIVVMVPPPLPSHMSSRASSEAARPGTHAAQQRCREMAWVPALAALGRDGSWGRAGSSLLLRCLLQSAVEFLRGEVAALVVVADGIGGELRLPFPRGRGVRLGIA